MQGYRSDETERKKRTSTKADISEQKIQPERYTTIEVVGSSGKTYRIAVLKSIVKSIPRKWKWNKTRYEVANLLADGVPIERIVADPSIDIGSKSTIYGWLEHPEFREHVDALIFEYGVASKRERLARLKKVADQLYDQLMDETNGLFAIALTEKNAAPLLAQYQNILKLIAQEKEELREIHHIKQESKTELTADVNGHVLTGTYQVEELLNSRSDSEREKLEKELDKIGDEIIRRLSGWQ